MAGPEPSLLTQKRHRELSCPKRTNNALASLGSAPSPEAALGVDGGM